MPLEPVSPSRRRSTERGRCQLGTVARASRAAACVKSRPRPGRTGRTHLAEHPNRAPRRRSPVARRAAQRVALELHRRRRMRRQHRSLRTKPRAAQSVHPLDVTLSMANTSAAPPPLTHHGNVCERGAVSVLDRNPLRLAARLPDLLDDRRPHKPMAGSAGWLGSPRTPAPPGSGCPAGRGGYARPGSPSASRGRECRPPTCRSRASGARSGRTPR